ncbi:MAG: penicillin acylase family protein [Pseudomonadota bacterium]
MRGLFKTLYFVTLAGLITLGTSLALGYYLFSRSLPDFTAEVMSEDVSAEVEIIRDTFNVPHIRATNDQDAFFALGYVHAQDRLWQMMTSRRAAQGRLADLFGPSVLDQDRLARHLGFFGSAQQDTRILSEEHRDMLQSYADGVNAYVRFLAIEGRGRGAPEFFFFEPEIAPWQIVDSLAIQRHRAWQDDFGRNQDLDRARLALFAGLDMADAFLGQNTVKPGPTGVSLAATGERTTTGETLFSADYSADLSAPSEFYLARIDLQNGAVIGITRPGVPAISAGRNLSIAWSLSGSDADVMDFTAISPDLVDQADNRFELIQVADAPTHSEELQRLGNTILLPTDLLDLENITPSEHSIAVQWTGFDPSAQDLPDMIDLMRSSNLTDARSALSEMHQTGTALIADRNRVERHDYGLKPARSEWQGSRSDLPYLADRLDALWTGNANAEIQTPVEELDVTSNDVAKFGPARAENPKQRRLRKLISTRDVHSLQSFKDIQFDAISEEARALLPLMAKELWFSDIGQGGDDLSELRATALDLMTNWNGEMSAHLPQPLIYSAWVWELQRQIIRDELGPESNNFNDIREDFIRRAFTDEDGAGIWCDIVPSDIVETCDQLALRALNVALTRLSHTYGNRAESWFWGDAHIARHGHPNFGEDSWLDWIASIYQPLNGGAGVMTETAAPSKDGVTFETIAAPVARMVIDFSGSEQSGFVLSTGQSGHILSEHYDNLATRWRRGEYIAMSFDFTLARAGASGITVIRPTE